MALTLALAIASSVGAQTRVGSISGRVQSQDGTPAAGVRVAAMAAGAGDLIAFTLSDNAGRYKIDDIPPGRYWIAAGLIGSFTYLPGTTDEDKATTVSVAAGSTTEDLNFKLAMAAGVRIRGVVGIPASNFPKTRMATLTGTESEPKDAVVNDDGSFEFRGVLPGKYTIEFSPTAQEISLTVADTNIDSIKVKAPVVITGKVRVEDSGPALTSPSQVNAASTFLRIATIPSGGTYSYHPVAGNGTFAFTLPADATYGVEVYDLPIGYYVKSIRSGSTDVLAAKGIAVDDSLGPRELDIVLTKQRPATEPAGVTVRGRVTSNGGATPVGLQVTMTMTPPLYRSGVRSESDGSFVFHDVQPGIYSASINIPGRVTISTPVIVGNTNIDDVKLHVEAEISLNIRVRVANGNASAAPPVNVRFSRSDGRAFRAAVNRDGTLTASLPDGIYQATLSSLPARYVLESMTYGSADAGNSMTVESSKPPSELVITLRDREEP